MRVQSYTGSAPLPITFLFFNLQHVNPTRFIKLTCFRANTGFKLRDHIVVIESVLTHAAFLQAAFHI
ncbi:hypothetical protein MU480_13760, partial [Staphylococcus aureus]|nr:hypothetical protein [Staphylococcus aureus]